MGLILGFLPEFGLEMLKNAHFKGCHVISHGWAIVAPLLCTVCFAPGAATRPFFSRRNFPKFILIFFNVFQALFKVC